MNTGNRLPADQAERLPPPATYVADVIEQLLLPFGPKMFGRVHDADCILVVGDHKFFVHGWMLAVTSCFML